MSDKKINYLVMDVDGTMTDGKIYMGKDGEVLKTFNIKDGYAIKKILPQNNIVPVIITGRNSKILQRRCEELGIMEFYIEVDDKEQLLEQLLKKWKVSYENIAYVGDDLNDLGCMSKVAASGCPLDAANEIKKISHFVSKRNGGEGVIRDFIEWLLENENKYRGNKK